MADRLVTAAIGHWAPRFTANGVDANDFTRITAAISDWSGWCAAWCQAAAEHENLGRLALGDGRTRSGGGHLAQAAVYYHFAKFLFVQDMAQLRAAHAAAVRCLTDALPYLDPPGERIEIPFDGGVLPGILRRPRTAGPHPVVIMISGLDSAKEELRATEALFLDRGLATFAGGRPGAGRGRVRAGDPAGLGGARRRHHRRGGRAARPGSGPDRGLGGQPGRLLCAAAGQRRPASAGLRRAVRAV